MDKLNNLTGQRFGRLTVIGRSYPNSKWREAMHLCKCDCGKKIIASGHNLRSGNTKSCGCLNKERSSESNRINLGLGSMRARICNYKIDAKKRGHNFELTEEQFFKTTQKDCYYCGTKPNNISKYHNCNGSYIYNGLDRIDNNKGYLIDNVIPCCKFCNTAKSNLTLQEFKDWIKKVSERIGT